jgi:integrase
VAVIKLLKELLRIKDNPYVLPGEKPGTCFAGLPRVWAKIRKQAELDTVRIHDLRHSFASVGAAGGNSTTARYAHLANDPLKTAVDRISDSIAAAMSIDTAN